MFTYEIQFHGREKVQQVHLDEVFAPHSPEFSGGEVQAHTDSLRK